MAHHGISSRACTGIVRQGKPSPAVYEPDVSAVPVTQKPKRRPLSYLASRSNGSLGSSTPVRAEKQDRCAVEAIEEHLFLDVARKSRCRVLVTCPGWYGWPERAFSGPVRAIARWLAGKLRSARRNAGPGGARLRWLSALSLAWPIYVKRHKLNSKMRVKFSFAAEPEREGWDRSPKRNPVIGPAGRSSR